MIHDKRLLNIWNFYTLFDEKNLDLRRGGCPPYLYSAHTYAQRPTAIQGFKNMILFHESKAW